MRGLVEMPKTMGIEIVVGGSKLKANWTLCGQRESPKHRSIFWLNQRLLTIRLQKHWVGGLKKRYLRENFNVDIFEGRNWP